MSFKLKLLRDTVYFTDPFTMDDVLLSPFYVDEAKGVVRCKKYTKDSSGAVAFSLKHLSESDSTLTTQDYQSFLPQMNPSLFTSDGFVSYKRNTGTFYTHSFRGDTLCRFDLMPDFLPTGNYRGPEGFSAYSLNGQHFVRLPYDKTVYRLVDNHTLQAVYQLDFGSLRYATGKEVVGTANIDDAYQVKGWIETDKFIFIRIDQGHNSPINREKKAVKLYSLVYNKETGDFFSLPQPKELTYAALEGDLLDGMEWWPRSYQDGKMYRYYILKTLKEYPALSKQIEGVETLKGSEWILVIVE